MTAKPQSEPKQDKALQDTFPASDPPANSGITGAEETTKPTQPANTEEIPTGRPTSDRYGTETAHHDADHQTPAKK